MAVASDEITKKVSTYCYQCVNGPDILNVEVVNGVATKIERNYDVKAEDYPFWVLTARSMQYAWGGNVSLQVIKELADNVAGHDGIMINAKRAQDLGIAEGDMLEARSAVGATQGKAILRQGVHPEVLIMLAQFGHWKTPMAKEMKRPSLNKIVPMAMDFIDGSGSSVDAAKVQIRRVEA